MNHLLLVASIAVSALLSGVISAEDQCKKNIGDECDSTKDKPCYIIQKLFNAEFWVHLKCKGISVTKTDTTLMEVASWACKSVPAGHKLKQTPVGVLTFLDVKCGNIKSAEALESAVVVFLAPEASKSLGKSIACSPTGGLHEVT